MDKVMSETIKFKTPRLDAALAKLPKEARSMWDMYSQARPEDALAAFRGWALQTGRLSSCVDHRLEYLGDNLSAPIPKYLLDVMQSSYHSIHQKLWNSHQALRIMVFPLQLKLLEDKLESWKEKLMVLEAKRPSGDEKDLELEEKIREARKNVSKHEVRVEENLSSEVWLPEKFAAGWPPFVKPQDNP
ncbi:MAG: hypothetical protein Q9221_007175 [Calogaya cf. arnoldii]